MQFIKLVLLVLLLTQEGAVRCLVPAVPKDRCYGCCGKDHCKTAYAHTDRRGVKTGSKQGL
jgi:hypothetical protein